MQSQLPRQPSPQTHMSSDRQRNSSVIANGPPSAGGTSATGRPLKSKKKSLELPDLNLNSLSTITPVPQRVPSTLPSAPIPIPVGAANPNVKANGPPNDADNANRNQRTISEDALAAGPSSFVVPPPASIAPTKISSNASFGRKERRSHIVNVLYDRCSTRESPPTMMASSMSWPPPPLQKFRSSSYTQVKQRV